MAGKKHGKLARRPVRPPVRYRNAAPKSDGTRPAMPPGAFQSAMINLGGSLLGSALGIVATAEFTRPKTAATVITAAGGVAALIGHPVWVRDLGNGAMSGAASQLMLLVVDDARDHKRDKDTDKTDKGKTEPGGDGKGKLKNSRNAAIGELPSGALEDAWRRAQASLALAAAGVSGDYVG
ncbi:MAG TPA: hypothetical protein VGM88_12275 [Kofleriaceae bacterium]|jgi:hypothetical protein